MNVHAPAVHGAVPFCVLAPVTPTATVAVSPGAVPHAPPTEVTAAFVTKGNVRAVPFTVVKVTTGDVASMVSDLAPELPVLPAASVCVALSV